MRVINCGRYSELVITNRFGREIKTKIDTWRVDDVLRHKWYFVSKRDRLYVVSDSRIGPLHSFIIGKKKGFYTDHINNDSLDNRESNLRFVDNSTNVRNCKMNKRNTSGEKNIHFDKRTGKWVVQIKLYGQYKFLGRYRNIEDAIRVRNKFIK